MSDTEQTIDYNKIQTLNEKMIKSQFFTPDNIYIELGLLKDIPLGIIYADQVIFKDDEETFNSLNKVIMSKLKDYQSRTYDTINGYFTEFGYDDKYISEMLAKEEFHNNYFLMAPSTKFIDILIRHFIRNQNHSRPADKYMRSNMGNGKFKIDPVSVTCTINSYPLTLSDKVIASASELLGESLGANVRFICKDPAEFDQSDWDDWFKHIDCFYLDDLGRFTKSIICLEKQAAFELVGKWVFARKRFEGSLKGTLTKDEFEYDVARISAEGAFLFEFAWLQNNDVRLTQEVEDVPMDATTTT